MLEGLTLWLLLPMGIALGLALGRKAKGSDAATLAAMSAVYDNPDRAIAVLTEAVEKDPAAAELNLTLGALFRKRGEVDRALRLHESVLAQGTLKPDTQALALFELGLDCVKAGLLDRAVELFKQSAQHPAYEAVSLEQLLPIHEQLSEWSEALAVAAKLESIKGQSMALQRAHYWLELATLAEGENDADKARKLAQQALETDPACVRASLFLGRWYETRSRWTEAFDAYARVAQQNPRFLSEVIAPIERVCTEAGKPALFSDFLDGLDAAHGQDSAVWLARAQTMSNGFEQARYLADKLSRKPSWRGLIQFLSLPPAREAGVLTAPVDAFREALTQQLKQRPQYQCEHCGFTPSLLFWRCPSCKEWGTVRPSEDSL
jgi:lipopolysaccharide assembly protein B